MRILFFVLSLMGVSYAAAAIAPTPVPATDEVVLDEETILLPDGEEIVLTAEDEAFLNSDDEILFAEVQAPKVDVKTAPVQKK